MEKKNFPVKDTVSVYHFIVSPNKKIKADSTLIRIYTTESRSAYNWIANQSRKHGQNLSFKEYWPENKDTILKKTFVYKLPTTNLTILSRSWFGFRRWVYKATDNEKKRQLLMNWRENMFYSFAASVKDTNIKKTLIKSTSSRGNKNTLMVIHLIKAKKSKVLGFYSGNAAFIGDNRSGTIAHESIHHLGAHDLYIHKYWFGKRRRLVKKEVPDEIMNNTHPRDCSYAYLSSYTAYCIGWDKELERKYKPLMKVNLQALFNFMFWLK